MLFPSALITLLPLASALSSRLPLNPIEATRQYLFSNPPVDDADFKIPTVHESAVMARRVLQLSSLCTLVTSFPVQSSSDEPSASENRPDAVEGSPIGMMEYYGDCESDGNPTLLAINIATPFRNYAAGSNISLSVRWWPKASNIYYPQEIESLAQQQQQLHNAEIRHPDQRPLRAPSVPDIPTPHTPAALPRFSLHGHLEPISTNDLIRKFIPGCFLRAHPDSVLWQPGNDVHESQYMRLVVEHVFWFGGFGDRARIGWLPLEQWQDVTPGEIDACRLPGEKGYEEPKEPKIDGGKKEGWWREWL